MAHPGESLVIWQGDLQARSRAFTSLHDDDQRRLAVGAAAEKDLETLWLILEAYLVLQGKSGARASRHTLRNYHLGLRVFLSHASENAWNLLSPGRHAAQLWVNGLGSSVGPRGQVLKPATVRLYVQAARALYRALRWSGATSQDPFRDVRLPRDHADALTARPPYQEDMLLRLIAHPELPAHLEVLLLLCAHAGLRIDEAVKLTWLDLALPGRRLTVRSGKGGKSRSVPLSLRLRAALERYQQTAAPGATFLFRYRSREGALYHLRKFVERAQPDTGVSWSEFRGFHAFRKLAGTRLYRRRKDLGAVATFLGHADIGTTRRYAAIAPEDYEQDLIDW